MYYKVTPLKLRRTENLGMFMYRLKGRFHEPTKPADESTLVVHPEANDEMFVLSHGR